MAVRPSRTRKTKDKAQREFVSEAEEIVERMRADLSDLQDQRRSDDGEVAPDLVNAIFRSAHSLKGLAGMFGYEAMGELAHHLEDVLDGLRLGRVSIESPAVDLLDEAVELVAALLESLGDSAASEANAAAVGALVERIDGAIRDQCVEEGDLGCLDLDPSLLRALTEYEEHRLRESLRRGRNLSLVDANFEIIAFEEGLAELSAAIREVGEVVSTLPSPGEAPESQIRFSLLVATDVPTEQLASRLDFSDMRVAAVYSAQAPAQPPNDATESVPTHSPERPEVAALEPGDTPEIESLKSISDTVRVDIRKLDELMNLVGELVIQRGAIAQIASRLSADAATARIGAELSKVHKSLDRKLRDLQSGVLDVRMVPLRQVFEKISRVVRRLRRDLDKDVRIEFKGADTELDKLIVEDLIDPLMHVVRNAFDHAIESENERVEAGKAARGTIRVEAFHRGNHVVIEVGDDGRGIDVEKVRAIAEARGIVSPDVALSPKESLALIFSAGLSTRDEVSETSGRGVGMDVVRANLTAVGGIVDVDSESGRGTTFTLTLPITLAIIQALLVRVGAQRFAIPLNSVLETLRVDETEIQHSENRELLNLRGEPLALRRLSDEFGIESQRDDGVQFVVVLGLGGLRLGLLVDGLEGQQDTVIKPIHGPIRQVRGIAGATELGDQGAILVLDVSSIVEDALRRREAA